MTIAYETTMLYRELTLYPIREIVFREIFDLQPNDW